MTATLVPSAALSFATESLVVQVNGAELSDELARRLLSVVVEDSVTLPGSFTLVFRDPFHDVPETGLLAFGASVSISLPDGRALVKRAEITSRECEVDSAGTVTVVRGFDLAHRLHRGRRTEVYCQVRHSDVARQVAQRAGLQVDRVDTPSTSIRPQVVQWNASDWEFLNELADEIAFEVTVADGKLSFTERAAAAGRRGPEISLEGVTRLRCVVSGAEQVKDVEVRGWSAEQKKEVVGTAPVAARGSALADTPAGAATRLNGQTLTSVDKLYDQPRDATAAAQALAHQVGESFGTFEGLARGNPALRAGAVVSLALAGSGFDGTYTLTATRHVFDDDGYTTWFASGGAGDESLLGMASGSARGAVEGVVPAVVTNVRDPSKLGRVKVSFPWLSSSNETHWARVAQPWVGPDYGAVFLPEVNDEVLIAFEQGDFARPYVVGGLYNGRDKPKTGAVPLVDDASGTINVRRMETRKHHAVEIVDKFGSEGVFVKTGDGKHALELDVANTKISVSSQGKVTITGTGGVEITSPTGNVDIKGGQVSIQGNAVTLDARGPLNLKAGASAVLQGAIVKIN
ncbi:MAG: VgrG-related protein [Actinomycetota bacterium]|nr:VgrG-related protein [Actinomycetota bacterium]